MSYTAQCEEQSDVTIPEDTIIRAKVVAIEYKEIPYVHKKSGENRIFTKLIWTFEITEPGPWQGWEVRGETQAKLTIDPENDFRNWSEALLGRDIGVGFQLSTEDLVGLNGKITIRHEPDRNDPKRKWRRVDEVLPAGGFNDAPPF